MIFRSLQFPQNRRRENKNTCRWPILMVISVQKIVLSGQFWFNLSSKTWLHVFFVTHCTTRKTHSITCQNFVRCTISQSVLQNACWHSCISQNTHALIFHRKTHHLRKQEAGRRDTTQCFTEYFAKSFKVTQGVCKLFTKTHLFHTGYTRLYAIKD